MRTVTVEVPEGHMVKIVKEESMEPQHLKTSGLVQSNFYRIN